jgi:cytoplasmic iron level regulating protein YaaA (DUF328/UPF0246 family)
MLMLISPAKTLDYSRPVPAGRASLPDFLPQSEALASILRLLAPHQIAELMGLSDKLAQLNFERFQNWQPEYSSPEGRQAVFAFMGDVYEGLDVASLNPEELDYLSGHLRILSGLYGLLRPMDLMLPYRLEMGTKLANQAGSDLYAFWGDTLVRAINALNAGEIVNLASTEYFKAVPPKKLAGTLITPVFEDWSGGKYKIVSFYAKRARGLMVRWAAQNRVSKAEALRQFNLEGYALDEAASDGPLWRFRRKNGQ